MDEQVRGALEGLGAVEEGTVVEELTLPGFVRLEHFYSPERVGASFLCLALSAYLDRDYRRHSVEEPLLKERKPPLLFLSVEREQSAESREGEVVLSLIEILVILHNPVGGYFDQVDLTDSVSLDVKVAQDLE